jgi:hypothetical protein
MGEVIGGSDAFSTWGKCRTPIFKSYHGATGPGTSNGGNHNLQGTNGYLTQKYTFFRCARHWTVSFWDDGSGIPRTQFNGPFAFPNPPFPPTTQFLVGAYDPDMAEVYAPHFLDDVEIQAAWVGRGVVIDGSTYSMDYSALNGETGSAQTITSSAAVISFDL